MSLSPNKTDMTCYDNNNNNNNTVTTEQQCCLQDQKVVTIIDRKVGIIQGFISLIQGEFFLMFSKKWTTQKDWENHRHKIDYPDWTSSD